MTHRERAALALDRKIPDYVPTFELEFYLGEQMFGKKWLNGWELDGITGLEREKLLRQNAENHLEVYKALEHSIIPIQLYLAWEDNVLMAKYIREMSGDEYMLTVHGDGTFSIPDGDGMYDFAYRTVDDREGLHAEAERMANEAIERNKMYAEAGIDSLILCCDYCYNSGPFLSPEMFEEYIQPYLYKIIKSARENGQYTIKHTDGNIMPILNQLVDCNPHALHSIDPMAGVDIKEVKELVGDKVALCGNVHCAALQTGSEQDVIDSAEYAMRWAKPGGGFIYCTSNVPFKGLDPKRYQLVLDAWKKHRNY